MKLIKLTQGYYTKVNDEDFELLNQYKWCVITTDNLRYAQRMTPKFNGKRISLKMHRVILNLTNPNIHTDHKDHDGLNNQRFNLRICTASQNAKNRRPFGTSKYLGVSLHISTAKQTNKNGELVIYKSRPRWVAHIKTENGYKHLGLFDNEIDAAKAYDEAAIIHHGEFANLNILINQSK